MGTLRGGGKGEGGKGLYFLNTLLITGTKATYPPSPYPPKGPYDLGHQLGAFSSYSLAQVEALASEGWLCTRNVNTGPLIIRIGFGGILYYTYHKGPPK